MHKINKIYITQKLATTDVYSIAIDLALHGLVHSAVMTQNPSQGLEFMLVIKLAATLQLHSYSYKHYVLILIFSLSTRIVIQCT